MRAFLGGLVVGLGVSGLAAGAVSLVMPLPSRPDVDTSAANAPGAPTGAEQPVPPNGADADLVDALPTAPQGEDAQPDANPETTDLAPGVRPQIGDATDHMADPQDDTAPDIASENAQQPETQTASSAPQTPDQDVAPSMSTDPAQPQMPKLAEAPSADDARPAVGQSDADSSLEEQANAQPQSPEPETSEETLQSQTEQPRLPQISGSDAPATAPDAPKALASATADPAELKPGVGAPVAPLIDRAQERHVTPPENPPIAAFAQPFDNPDDRPLMAIVLVDDDKSIGTEALRDFPYPVTFALDPSDPEATAKMAAHRAAGFETVMIADLAPEATPQDAETAFELWQNSLPETVAILEGARTGFQGNRALSDQVTTIAQTTGWGLVTQSNGLNTAQKLASRAGIPSSVVFRDFDSAGQTPTIMRRFLDQAAFRARQEGGVIMLGRVQPDTVSALVLWGLQDRAQRVALAPISAILTQEPKEP